MLTELAPKKMNRQMPVDVCALDARRYAIRFGALTVERWKLDKTPWVKVFVDENDPGVVVIQFTSEPTGLSWRRLTNTHGKYPYREFCYGELFHRWQPKHGRYRMERDKTGLVRVFVQNGYVGEMRNGSRKKEGE